MNISSILTGYVHSAAIQPKPGQPRPVKDDDGSTQQQAASQAAAKGSVNLLV